MPRRYQIIGGGSAFASGGVTNNVVPKSNGAGQLADSSITDNGTTVSTTEPIVVPDTAGSGVPSVKGATAATGLYLNTTVAGLVSTTNGWIAVGNTALTSLQLPLNGAIAFSTSGLIAAAGSGLILRERVAANLAMGTSDVNGAPVAQTISVQNAITGTDLTGADWTLNGSIGTGAGVPKAVNIQTSNVLGTGTTAQTNTLGVGIRWFKALANNTVTTVASLANANNTSSTVIIHYGIEIFDGTNVQYEVGAVAIGINNKAGAFTQNTATKFGNIQGVTSGTLTVTWTITAANPGLIQVNSNSSLTTTTNRLFYTIDNLSNQACTQV